MPEHPPTRDHDVVVVGGRCAGAATALLLAARGVDVCVVEQAPMPSDTLSTHALARGGVVQLSRWGLLAPLLATGAPAIRTVTFTALGSGATLPIKDRAGVDHLVAPRRHVLDGLLLDAARDAGATVHTLTQVTGLRRDPVGRVTGVTVAPRPGASRPLPPAVLHARHVVAADGVRSSLARAVSAPVLRHVAHDVAVFYAYVDEVPWGGIELHVGHRAYAGVFPTHAGAACVWLTRPAGLLDPVRVAGAGRATAFTSALRSASPDLAERVAAGRIHPPVRGWVAPPSTVRRAHGRGWSLVGDAGAYRDPITGHGITDAFRDAELLADALTDVLGGSATESRALAAFEAERDRAIGPVLDVTDEMTTFPHPSRFAELQVELARLIDAEAQSLASRPAPPGLRAAPAA